MIWWCEATVRLRWSTRRQIHQELVDIHGVEQLPVVDGSLDFSKSQYRSNGSTKVHWQIPRLDLAASILFGDVFLLTTSPRQTGSREPVAWRPQTDPLRTPSVAIVHSKEIGIVTAMQTRDGDADGRRRCKRETAMQTRDGDADGRRRCKRETAMQTGDGDANARWRCKRETAMQTRDGDANARRRCKRETAMQMRDGDANARRRCKRETAMQTRDGDA